MAKYLRDRIIIPAYNKDDLMYWQARIFVGDSPKKYVSSTVENSNSVIYGMGNMFNDPEIPLYVTEGFFDSWHVKGVAVMNNTMKSSKIQLLNRTRRIKVVIPDYNMDGMNLADQAIDQEWGVSLPEYLPCTDICSAIQKFGKLYVINTIVQKTYYGFEAKLRLKDFKLKNYKFLK
jgi:hypothetical protein